MEPDDSMDLLAAALRADMHDLHLWLGALATKLAGALPDHVTIQRGGFLGNGPIVGLTADLGQFRFILRQEHHQLVAERTHVVRGIALKTEPVPLDAWIDDLTATLTVLAATSARERAAIDRLLH